MQGGQRSSQDRVGNTRGRGSLVWEDRDSETVLETMGSFQDWKWDMEGRGRVAG